MKKISYNIRYFATAVIMCGALTVAAQDRKPAGYSPTPAGVEYYKLRNIWMNSLNPAGAILDNPLRYGTLEAGYNWTDGDFHLPQYGKKENAFTIHTDGMTVLRGFVAWGSFDYTRQTQNDARYKLSTTDLRRKMPYYTIDPVASDWRNHVFDMSFRLAGSKKLWNLLYYGVDGHYAATSAAKQHNILSNNRIMDLTVRPGILFEINPSHHIGLTFQYDMWMEDSSNDTAGSNFGTEREYVLWEVTGLGNITERFVTKSPGRTQDYQGHTVGGGLQYGFTRNNVELILSGKYSYRVERSNRGFTTPQTNGMVKENLRAGRLQLNLFSACFSHLFDVNYLSSKMDGIQYVMRYDENLQKDVPIYRSVRSKYDRQQASITYDMVKRGYGKLKGEYAWKIDAGASYDKLDDVFLLPVSEFLVENIGFDLGGKVNFCPGQRSRILVGALVTVNRNMDSRYIYNGNFPDYPSVTQMNEELAFLSSDYVAYNASCVFSMPVGPAVNAYVKANYTYVKASDSVYDKRQFIKVSMGCNF